MKRFIDHMMPSAVLLAAAMLLCDCGGGGASAFAPPPPAPPPGAQVFGPPWLTAQDTNGVGWTGCVDYEAARDGDGCFIQFLASSKSGDRLSGVTLNGGLVDATAGHEQGDLDIAILVDGKTGFNVSVIGNPPSLTVWPPDTFVLGGAQNRWKAIYLTGVPCPANVPGNPAMCISANGGFVPVYK